MGAVKLNNTLIASASFAIINCKGDIATTHQRHDIHRLIIWLGQLYLGELALLIVKRAIAAQITSLRDICK